MDQIDNKVKSMNEKIGNMEQDTDTKRKEDNEIIDAKFKSMIEKQDKKLEELSNEIMKPKTQQVPSITVTPPQMPPGPNVNFPGIHIDYFWGFLGSLNPNLIILWLLHFLRANLHHRATVLS